MSEAQRCANVMRRYGLGYDRTSIERGCYEATSRELERQEARIAELEQQLEAANKRKAKDAVLLSGFIDALEVWQLIETAPVEHIPIVVP